MPAIAKTCITAHSGDILSKNGYGLYINPFRNFGSKRVRFQFDDPTYDPTTSPLGYKAGAHWVQVSTSPNLWDYWREDTDWKFEFGPDEFDPDLAGPSDALIQSPCSVVIANLEGVTNILAMFHLCTKIHDVYNFYAPDATTTDMVFYKCAGVRTFDIVSMESARSYGDTFGYCTSMAKAPMFEFSPHASNANGMFAGCTSLVDVPLYDTSAVMHFNGMFSKCTSLEHVPVFDTASAKGMQAMFERCLSLKDAPPLNTHNVENMTAMFVGCRSLKTVPLYDTSNAWTVQGMFEDCTSLESVPLFNTSSVESFQDMFKGCSSLKRIPLFDTSSAIYTQNPAISDIHSYCFNMFDGCVSVEGGALALYQQWITQTGGYPSNHTDTFKNCGANTVTGVAELQQIPTSWGGLKEE